MRKLMILFAFTCCALVAYVYADTKGGYQQATVVKVDECDAPSVFGGSNPSDAPLQPEVFAYDIALKVNCDLYVGRYQSAFDYLPPIFARDHAVDVRVQKHILYVSLPDSDREVKMGIVTHSRVKQASCTTN
jgi:hypothetical protein